MEKGREKTRSRGSLCFPVYQHAVRHDENRVSFADGDGLQLAATLEWTVADVSQRGRQIDFSQRGASGERIIPEGFHALMQDDVFQLF